MKAADPAICALYKIGTAYQNMADSIANAPMPRGMPPDLQDAIKDELTKQSTPIREKAADAFAAAVSKSRELTIVNDCSSKALGILRDGLRPDQFPPMQEEVIELKTAGFKATATGGDVLTQVQPVLASVNLLNPPKPDLNMAPKAQPAANSNTEAAPAAPANVNKPAAKEDDLNDLGSDMAPPKKGDEAKKAPDDDKPLPSLTPKKNKTEEPEDSL